jgi:hypothetical protein
MNFFFPRQMAVQPHVLILPSDLLHFFKELNGCLVMNPQRLAKGESGGVFARCQFYESSLWPKTLSDNFNSFIYGHKFIKNYRRK